MIKQITNKRYDLIYKKSLEESALIPSSFTRKRQVVETKTMYELLNLAIFKAKKEVGFEANKKYTIVYFYSLNMGNKTYFDMVDVYNIQKVIYVRSTANFYIFKSFNGVKEFKLSKDKVVCVIK